MYAQPADPWTGGRPARHDATALAAKVLPLEHRQPLEYLLDNDLGDWLRHDEDADRWGLVLRSGRKVVAHANLRDETVTADLIDLQRAVGRHRCWDEEPVEIETGTSRSGEVSTVNRCSRCGRLTGARHRYEIL